MTEVGHFTRNLCPCCGAELPPQRADAGGALTAAAFWVAICAGLAAAIGGWLV